MRLSRAPVCDFCWNYLPPQEGTLCVLCGEDLGVAQFSTPRSLSNADEDRLCQPCRLAAPAFQKAVAHGVYQGQLRSLIHLLKYDRVRPVADRLGKLLALSLAKAGAAPRCMMVVPVPLHRSKRRERGFNQAELLARAVISELRRDPQWQLSLAVKVLERRKATASQAGLTTRQRRENLRGAFLVTDPARIAGRHVLLIDDVYTTGATARACSRSLIAAGAASVQVATVARAQREGTALWDSHLLSPAKTDGPNMNGNDRGQET